MEKNLDIYSKVRTVPANAQRTINGGRLNGKTDINPMWRIKVMTETFGPCGFGWRYEITKQWCEIYGNEVKAFVNVDLYIKVADQWSEAIPGTGGSSMVETGRNGAYVNDEAYKMALTDALSVAMKALGVGADIYFAGDAAYETKYEAPKAQPKTVKKADAEAPESAPKARTLASQKEEDLIKLVITASDTAAINNIYMTAPAAYQKKGSRLYAACLARATQLQTLS